MIGIHGRALARYLLSREQREGAIKAPDELVIIPPGPVETTNDGPAALMDEIAARSCIEFFEKLGRDMVIDYEHQTEGGEFSAPNGRAPAAGWIHHLYWDASRGLVAKVSWTEEAARLIERREYRYHSPVMYYEKKEPYRVLAIKNIALTNDPAMLNIKPLVAKNTRCKEVSMKNYKQLLGLGEDATIAEIEAALNAGNIAVVAEALGCKPKKEEIMKKIKEIEDEIIDGDPRNPSGDDGGNGGSGGDDELEPNPLKSIREFAASHSLRCGSIEEFLGSVEQELKMQKDGRAALQTLRNSLNEAQTRIAAIEEERNRMKYDVLLASTYKGRVPPADVDAFYRIWRSDPEAFEAAVKLIPPVADNRAELTGVNDGGGVAKRFADRVQAIMKERNVGTRYEAIAILSRTDQELYQEAMENGCM